MIKIYSENKKLLERRRVRATTKWRYWDYKPRCGCYYLVRYETPNGRSTEPVYVNIAG